MDEMMQKMGGKPNGQHIFGALRRDSAIPLYHQLYCNLRDAIMTKRLPYGANVPTELELSSMYSVSRITARRALDELALEKLVKRRRRTGTVVVYKALTVPIESDLVQAVDSLVAMGRTTFFKVLALGEEPVIDPIAHKLNLPLDGRVVRAQRLQYLEQEPVGEITSYVPTDLGVELTEAKIAKTPILDLLRTAGLNLSEGRQTISAHLANTAEEELLLVEPRDPILRIEYVTLDANKRPILFTVANYRADRYRISAEIRM